MKAPSPHLSPERKKHSKPPVAVLRKITEVAARATGVNLVGEKFQQTKDEEWPKMTTKQRLGAVAATAVSFGRLVREGVKLGKPDSERG